MTILNAYLQGQIYIFIVAIIATPALYIIFIEDFAPIVKSSLKQFFLLYIYLSLLFTTLIYLKDTGIIQ